MRARRSANLGLLLLAAAGAGCGAHQSQMRPGLPMPSFKVPATLPAVLPSKIEPDYSQLPSAIDALAPIPPANFTYRGLDESSVQCLAAANSALANLLDAENALPSKSTGRKHCDPGDDLLREIRRLAALEARNRAAAEALERWLQLADTEGRRELYIAGIGAFDQLRANLKAFRDAGLTTPSDSEILEQRAKLLADLYSLDASIALLNHDLASRLNQPLAPGERFWPTDDFAVADHDYDIDATIKNALMQRPELQALRTLRDKLTPGSLPAARDTLRMLHALAGQAPPPSILDRFRRRNDPSDQQETEQRRKQLTDRLILREAEAAAEIRTALGQMTAVAKKIAALRAKAESIGAKLAAAKAANKTADILTYETEHFKARSEVLAAVMEWHQWRVRWKAAQGLLAAECLQ